MTARTLAAALALLVTACNNADDHPRPVDPPPCYPHCPTEP